MYAGAGLMAREPKGSKKKAESQAPDERVAIIHLKGSPAYAAWLEAAHRKTHIAKASIVRVALAEWAERHGIESPPEL